MTIAGKAMCVRQFER